MLELRNVSYQPATAVAPVLCGVSLSLAVGRPSLVAGRSGSGKTTLLEVISGLAEPSGGQVLWEGQQLNGRQLRWLCGLVFQFPERHFLGLSVGQELKLGHRRLTAEEAQAALQLVGMEGLSLQQAPEQLSGGQQRRLALAVQLLRNPRVLLLDEPTAGLDWAVRGEILELLAALSQERAVLVVTHEPELFRGVIDGGWRLERGQLEPLGALPTMAPTMATPQENQP
ncbi:MAG: energy-coupling factor ABC transporter ATP-binding protein [Prochlorococcaceae cyanobacterium MAG_34]|jgi:energy-coupling factor transport system ATP-binding protein|nr:MAG: lytic murein transglycosylase [cyanobacterium BACL30 MAG-120619-bin27]MDP4737954.1 energy-coupling factor ABC transporter ATP-binding protein [Cyanobium sp. MAG_216]MDP4809203.1 energy-coupling factor ABC transporter ATP-binding protein [Cyanobium sp. MAG_160]MDP4880595.1 energy-coupling factor ABC transporter ATP-binding protein [Cyanobium sp. MAG_137]MDP4946731.1 energy-coupling factor ABC transporter ATP-binding protein [Cyanobium sp. MAG_102]MDP5118417.1 energy-coupling factor ABC 